mgnify:CR=1 FL=1
MIPAHPPPSTFRLGERSGKPRVRDLVALPDWFHRMGWVKENLPMSRVVDLSFLE